MRDIKFRGRALSNDNRAGIKKGDFVFGSFIKTDIDAPAIVWGDGEQMEVDIETVGQFTGRKDRQGACLYEGDIIDIQGSNTVICCENSYVGFYFFVEALNEFTSLAFLLGYKNFEIVGNTHQNPEMLEGTDNA